MKSPIDGQEIASRRPELGRKRLTGRGVVVLVEKPLSRRPDVVDVDHRVQGAAGKVLHSVPLVRTDFLDD